MYKGELSQKRPSDLYFVMTRAGQTQTFAERRRQDHSDQTCREERNRSSEENPMASVAAKVAKLIAL
jgi:hypothetical protein